jgi:hypothetical protein
MTDLTSIGVWTTAIGSRQATFGLRTLGSRAAAIVGRAGAIVAALAAAGCTTNEPDPNALLPGAPSVTPPDIAVVTQTALSQIANQGYTQSPAFTQASTLYPSTKDPVDIVEWVSTAGDAAAGYAQISPEADAGPANVTLPTGTIIVRAVYNLPDAGGFEAGVQYLTVLVKGPTGTNQSVGDWWFGVTDPNGNPCSTASTYSACPIVFPDGGAEVGLPMTGTCESCHTGRGVANDYLFGVPPTARAAAFGQ